MDIRDIEALLRDLRLNWERAHPSTTTLRLDEAIAWCQRTRAKRAAKLRAKRATTGPRYTSRYRFEALRSAKFTTGPEANGIGRKTND